MCSSDLAGDASETLILRRDPMSASVVDLHESGETRGDRRMVELTFDGEENEPPVLRGYLMTIDVADASEPTHGLLGIATITFDDGSTIVLGDARRVDPAKGLADGPHAWPILGGTGRYAGIGGEMVTTLDADGRITETLTIRR